MYRNFYGLKTKPFNVTADPNFLFLSRKHQEAFSHLLYGVRERKGFIEITGEVGTGKTTLCRALLNYLDNKTKTAFIFNPNLSETQLLEAISNELEIKPPRRNRFFYINELNKFLIEELSQGHNVALIIDEAQNLKPRALEQVRLLSNLETEKEKLLQIVLVGQPELHSRLESESLRQLRQRISVRCQILPLDKDEVVGYINHRLKVAGSNGKIKFTDEALEEIFLYSKGFPRLINILCDKALLAGYVLEKKTIDGGIIQACIKELEG